MSVSRQAISKWERNESYPDTENLIAIARFFNVSIDDLINKPLDSQAESDSSEINPSHEFIDESASNNSEAEGKKAKHRFSTLFWRNVPYPIIITVIYLLWGFLADGWQIGWVLYVTIPIYDSVIHCINCKRFTPFNYPVFITFVFLLFGMLYGIWHPLWVIYLTIPVYYPIANSIDSAMRNKRK